MTSRSQVPKWVEREKGIIIYSKTFKKGTESTQDMNFNKANARKKRPDTGKKLTKSHHSPNLKY